MSQRLEFQRTIARMIFYLAAINVILTIGIFLTGGNLNGDTLLIMFIIVNISYLATIFSKPFRIIIDQDKSLLEIDYPLGFLRKPKVVPLNEVVCSFKDEVRARGMKSKVLRVMRDSKTILELIPDYNGWTEQSLLQICENLRRPKKT